MTKLPCRLFSPQYYLKNKSNEIEDPEILMMIIRYDKAILKTVNGNSLSINYDTSTNLPVLEVETNLIRGRKQVLSYQGSVIDETNQNLTYLQKNLLKWHCKLGHIGMSHVQWLGRNNYLDKMINKWGDFL